MTVPAEAVLLDTHVWLWWLSDPARLSEVARDRIHQAVDIDGVHISAISAWEVALLVKLGRLALDRPAADFVRATQALPFVHFVDVDPRIAVLSVDQAEPLHRDPADRILAATARVLGVTLLTADSKLLGASGFKTAW